MQVALNRGHIFATTGQGIGQRNTIVEIDQRIDRAKFSALTDPFEQGFDGGAGPLFGLELAKGLPPLLNHLILGKGFIRYKGQGLLAGFIEQILKIGVLTLVYLIVQALDRQDRNLRIWKNFPEILIYNDFHKKLLSAYSIFSP